jgi:hypothetical protein
LEITSSLRNSLAELYFREESSQKGWAVASLAELHNGGNFADDHMMTLRIGGKTVRIKLMPQLVPEITEMSRPAGSGEEKTFVFDYLACRIGHAVQDAPVVANPTALSWVHVKTAGAPFSEDQLEALPKIQLAFTVFSIRDVLAPPRNLEFRWDTRSGSEWLDFVDELKEQEEYDDEYF